MIQRIKYFESSTDNIQLMKANEKLGQNNELTKKEILTCWPALRTNFEQQSDSDAEERRATEAWRFTSELTGQVIISLVHSLSLFSVIQGDVVCVPYTSLIILCLFFN